MKPFSQRWRDASDEAKDQPMEEPNDRLQAEVDKCGEAINHHIVMEDSLRKQITRLTAELDAAKDSLEKERAYRDSELDKAHQKISNLRAELDAVRKERDEVIKQRTEWVCDLADQRDAAQAKCAELERELLHQRGALMIYRDRQGGTASLADITVGIERIDKILTPAPPEEKRQ